jgi:3-hydroxyisobutyrate dehydrogenase-like beta-hydroxyacid dehydrogenase
MPEEDKRLVNAGGVVVEDAEDAMVEVTVVEVVVLDKEEVEEVVEEENVVPSSEAPFLTVKMSLTASWPAESIIWIS